MTLPARAGTRALLLAAAAAFALLTGAVGTQTAAAYDVCDDDGSCVHEYLAEQAAPLFPHAEIQQYMPQITNGAEHEDTKDHIFGYVGFEGSFVTITHFWDADKGDTDPVENVLGSFENAMQKAQSLWSIALGHYAKGNKAKAYHYLGHVAHLIGDQTVPTHTHDDMHAAEAPLYDDDAYEDWMSQTSHDNRDITPAEQAELKAKKMIQIPPTEPDGVYYLLYTTNQIADFFASDNYDGDAIDESGRVSGELAEMAATIASPRTKEQTADNDVNLPGLPVPGVDFPTNDYDNNDDGDLGRIRKYSYLRAPRAIAALYKLFTDTVARQVSAVVTIDKVQARDMHDYGPPFIPFLDIWTKYSDPDFYARVRINGGGAQNRGNAATGNTVTGAWPFAQVVGTTGSIPVRVEIWDEDGEGNDTITFGGEDDPSDITQGDGNGLDLNVDMAKCLTGADGAVTGPGVSSKCGVPIVSPGPDALEASIATFTINLSKSPPTADAGADYETDEGTNIELTGSGSKDPDNDITTYAWDLDGDGACDDVENDPTPDFTAVGQDGSTTVKLCVTDAAGLTSEDKAKVTVKNVTPKVTLNAPGSVKEKDTVTVSGTISDPGWLDTPTATIDWGDGSAPQSLSGTPERDRPDATLTFNTTHVYGDNGSFTVRVCGSDDDSTACQSAVVQVDNVAPTAKIAATGSVLVNGVSTFLAHAGQAVTLTATTTDPGSDDLTLAWNWGDGTPVVSSLSLVNPPNPDGLPSPTVQPRNESQTQSHAFGKACAFQSTFSSTDDDGGGATDTANVIIVGNAVDNGLAGFWHTQFNSHLTGRGNPKYDAPTLTCYLTIARYMSRVLDEKTPSSTFAQAEDVLNTAGTNVMTELFDQHLLAAWLNFANGAIEYDQLVDTDANRTLDTPFLQAMAGAEAVRLDPSSTRTQLERKKNMLDAFNRLT